MLFRSLDCGEYTPRDDAVVEEEDDREGVLFGCGLWLPVEEVSYRSGVKGVPDNTL